MDQILMVGWIECGRGMFEMLYRQHLLGSQFKYTNLKPLVFFDYCKIVSCKSVTLKAELAANLNPA